MARPANIPSPPTEDEKAKIIRCLSKGALIDTAIAHAGVPRKVFNRWLALGGQGVEPYQTFQQEIDQALIKFEMKLLDFIAENANKNVNAATWMFNMRFGAKYKKHLEEELKVPEDEIKRIEKTLSNEEIDSIEQKALDS